MYQHYFHDTDLKGQYLNETQPNVYEDLKHAINREYTAICFYNDLTLLTPSEKTKNHIISIKINEQRHLNEFSNFYQKLTSYTHSPEIIDHCPDDYSQALETAFFHEQQSVQTYLNIADRIKNPYFKDRFKRIAADEQKHAMWMLYYLNESFQ
ncbi:ferritin family protein [Alkalibacillus silvisoli]|uniref:Ferritin-like domain-containing protein n=1 Tax=Alkalibacillus silvisoli TaxID=392823 RepID=A0ABP3JEE4_9BACI